MTLLGFANDSTLSTLIELKKSRDLLQSEINAKNKRIGTAQSDDEKVQLSEEIKQLQLQRNQIKERFESIASGVDSTDQNGASEKGKTLSEDFQLLLQPLIQKAKESTETMRKKTTFKEEVTHETALLEEAKQALANIKRTQQADVNTSLEKELAALAAYWEQQVGIISGNLNATQHQLDILKQNEKSLGDSLNEGTKNFFENQGIVLFKGLIALLMVLVVMKLLSWAVMRAVPRTMKKNRTFYVRLIDLSFRVLTFIFAFLAPILVFFYEENWLLSSIGILFILGVLWTLKQTIPKFWHQAILFLNVGPVREEERIIYRDLPWQVKRINFYTMIENPDSGVKLRIPIEELAGLTSRPGLEHGPWFPCRLHDWVVLSDDYYGKVVGISLEFIKLTDPGAGFKTYNVSDFLSLSPLNLSNGFRLIDTIGISYTHQKESTGEIVQQLEAFIHEKIIEEGYVEGLERLSVQFSHAGDSSLDIDVVALFKSDMAPMYLRLRRAISRWCVEACTHYGWEIPFPQLTVHRAEK